MRKEEEEEEEEEEEGEGEGEDQKGMFSCMESSVFWVPKVLVWRLVPYFLGFCGEITQTLELLKLWGKNPNWDRINMESIIIIWFCRNWWTLG